MFVGRAHLFSTSIVREILGRLELELNEGKTKIVDANKEAFRFLGFELKMNVGSKGMPYPHIKPAAKAVEKVKTRINEITARNGPRLRVGSQQ